MSVIKTRIEKAQKEYEDTCDMHDKDCVEAIKQAETDRDNKKAGVADNLVNEILGKIL